MSGASDPIAAVIARMEAVASELSVADGVSRFNHLYLEVTRSVDAALQLPGFEDAVFMTALDVCFADLYFDALDACDAGRSTPRCWAPLLAVRGDASIASIQFALAGMNAHINHDLSLALVATCEGHGIDPAHASPQYRDYVRLKDILVRVEARVKHELLTGLLGVADHVLGRIDDVVAIWSIVEARNAAWTHAEMLWALREDRELTAAFERALDGSVGFASRGLLVPTLF